MAAAKPSGGKSKSRARDDAMVEHASANLREDTARGANAEVRESNKRGPIAMPTLELTNEQRKHFEDYFGVHPQLLEGSRYFGNSENQPFIEEVTGTDRDVCRM